MADRYVVAMESAETRITYEGKASDELSAILACVRMGGVGPAPAGTYEAEVGIYGCKPVTRRVGVRADGSLTIGARWGLPTPTEPIDRADLGVDVGVPA